MRGDSLLWAWQELGVPEGSGLEECRRAYRRLMLANHPDLQGRASPSDVRLSEERTKDLNRAWSILKEYFHGDSAGTPPVDERSAYAPPKVGRSRRSRRWVAHATLLALAAGAVPLACWLVVARDPQQASSLRPLRGASGALGQARRPQTQNSASTNALINAADMGDYAEVSQLVSAGVDPNRPNERGFYALSVLATNLAMPGRFGEERDLAAMEFLLRQGASQEALQTAMFCASDSVRVLGLLLNAGASANAKDHNGNTVLHVTRSPDVVAKLVACGANVNALNNEGRTPLDVVASFGPQSMVPVFLRFHAHRSPSRQEVPDKTKGGRELGLVEFVGVNPRTGLPTRPKAIRGSHSVANEDYYGQAATHL